MSLRDPMEELAEYLLRNLADWWAEVRVKEPRLSQSWIRLRGTRGVSGNVVETFVFQRDELYRVLSSVRRVIKRMPRHLRQVYRLRYVRKLPREDIAIQLRIGLRTVDHRLAIIRGRVAGRLQCFNENKLAGFWQEIRRFLAR